MGLILVHTVKQKPIIKAQISGKLVTSGINDEAISLVHSEKARLRKMIMIIIIISMKLQSRRLTKHYMNFLSQTELGLDISLCGILDVVYFYIETMFSI